MRILVLHNPVSGRGRSGEVADRVRVALLAKGIHVERYHTPAAECDPGLIEMLHSADAAVIVGGDGAMRRVADGLMHTQTPVYNVPCGTENLFARQFGMTTSLDKLTASIKKLNVQSVDVGRSGEHPFLLMCGFGADASIVHRLTRNRRGAISHASYIRHILAEVASGRSPSLTIRADGRTIVNARRGAAIFANSRQYALRINPAPGACMHDGLLNLVFFPSTLSAGALAWYAASLLRIHQGSLARRVGMHSVSAQSFQVIRHDERGLIQLDGDALQSHNSAADPVTIACETGRLRVVRPVMM